MFGMQMLKDGNRTIIVIDGPSEEQDAAIHAMMQHLCKMFAPNPCPPPTVAKQSSSVQTAPAPPKEKMPDVVKKESEMPSVPKAEEKVLVVEGLEPAVPLSAPSSEDLARAVPYSPMQEISSERMTGGPYVGLTPSEVLHEIEEAALHPLNAYATSLPENSRERACIVRYCKQWLSCVDVSRYYGRDRLVAFLKNVARFTSLAVFINGYASVAAFVANATDDEIRNAAEAVASALRERGATN